MAVILSFTRHVPDKPVEPVRGLYLRGTNGASVVLVHGLTGTPHELRHLAGRLHNRGYTVICPPLANHGQPLEVLKRTTWQEFFASLREVLEVYGLKDSPGPVFAAGLSMGALLALLLALEYPETITAVSCLAPTLFYDGWNTPWQRHLLPLVYLTPLRYHVYFKEDPPYGIKNTILQRRVAAYYSTVRFDDHSQAAKWGYPSFPISLLQQIHLLVRELRRRLPVLTLPVQLIQARHDDMTSARNSAYIYGRIASRTKELVLLEDSYHIITADQERELVAAKVLEFFARVVPEKEMNLHEP